MGLLKDGGINNVDNESSKHVCNTNHRKHKRMVVMAPDNEELIACEDCKLLSKSIDGFPCTINDTCVILDVAINK